MLQERSTKDQVKGGAALLEVAEEGTAAPNNVRFWHVDANICSGDPLDLATKVMDRGLAYQGGADLLHQACVDRSGLCASINHREIDFAVMGGRPFHVDVPVGLARDMYLDHRRA